MTEKTFGPFELQKAYVSYITLNTIPLITLKFVGFKAEQIITKGKSSDLSKVNYIIILYIKIPNHV